MIVIIKVVVAGVLIMVLVEVVMVIILFINRSGQISSTVNKSAREELCVLRLFLGCTSFTAVSCKTLHGSESLPEGQPFNQHTRLDELNTTAILLKTVCT